LTEIADGFDESLPYTVSGITELLFASSLVYEVMKS
jgi:hypothetical protein